MTESMKHHIQVGSARVAYLDDGTGPPLLLVHGCPFSSYIWRRVIPLLRPHFRCIAPDLLGLGDTETPSDADWSLPAQAAIIVGLLDALGIQVAHVVAHDRGAATAQLIAAGDPSRIRRLVLTNAEAYDNWPSRDELPFIRATQLPAIGRLVIWAWARPALLRYALRSGRAVRDPAVLTPSCCAATSPPTSPTATAGPRPDASWPGSSTRPTTGPPPTRCPACAPSTTPPSSCGAATTRTSDPNGRSGCAMTSLVPRGSSCCPTPVTC
jgi:pimeloyl-ACP methyl ester carboxylesterase